MEIKIDQKFFVILRERYSVTSDGTEIFTAKSSIFHLPFKPKLLFYDWNGLLVLTMVKASLVHPEYDLYFATGEKSEFRVSDMVNFKYELTYQNTSVFKV